MEHKKSYKTISVDICEVENGFEVSIDYGFTRTSAEGICIDNQFSFVAKNMKEVLTIINHQIPTIKTTPQELSS